MSESLKGVLAMVLACLIWSSSSIYYKILQPVGTLEVLSHRIVWSFFLLMLIALIRGNLLRILGEFKPNYSAVAICGVLIPINWFVYIFAVQTGHATEASMGYYMFPIIAVFLGYFILHEQLQTLQWLAVMLAVIAVIILFIGTNTTPWIALILAFSFGLYGVVKKKLTIGPVSSVLLETFILVPAALLVLIAIHTYGWTAFSPGSDTHFGDNLFITILLILSGPITATPLLLMAYAVKRIDYATLGLVQYINPTGQFLIATLLFQELFTMWYAVAFILIWMALTLYTIAIFSASSGLR